MSETNNTNTIPKEGETFTAEEMEKMFPGFSKKVEEAKNGANNEDGGIDIGGRHYTKQQLEWMTEHPHNPPRKWTKAEKKARNKKNKAASKMRVKNRKK